MAGLYVLAINSLSQTGLFYGLLAGSFECITQAIRKRLIGISKGVIVLASLMGVLFVTGTSLLLTQTKFVLPVKELTWVGATVFALLVIIVNITVTYGFRLVKMNIGSVIMSSEIVFGTLFSMLLLTIKPTFTEIVASILVLLSIAIQNLQIKENNKVVRLVRRVLES